MKKYHIATLCMWLSFSANAVCDRMIFSEEYKQDVINFWWHICKWCIDRPLLFVSAILFYDTLYNYYKLIRNNMYWWTWHYPHSVKWFMAATIGGFALWQGVYYFASFCF